MFAIQPFDTENDLVREPEWQDLARCNDGTGSMTELFFSEQLDDIAAAKSFCLECPVKEPCLDAAMVRREPWGVWGGELFVNGKSIGRAKAKETYLFEFPNVKFEPGEIKAVAYASGKEHATQTKRTAGKPAALRMTPITGPGGLFATGSDYVLIDVEAVDEEDEVQPAADKEAGLGVSMAADRLD